MDGASHALAKELAFDFTGGVKLGMVLIPAGEFLMGSPDSDNNAQPFEKPQHKVRITRPFYLGKYPVTQEQADALLGGNGSSFKGPKNPVETVNWDFCQEFVKMLNLRFDRPAGKFRLPTEAQWEYACRAGSSTRYCFGNDEQQLDDYGWYSDKGSMLTHPVGLKKPNAWGLYDMHGNVMEWCADYWSERYNSRGRSDGPLVGVGTRGAGARGRNTLAGSIVRRCATTSIPEAATSTSAFALPSFRPTIRACENLEGNRLFC